MKLREAWYTMVHIAYDLVMKLNPRKLGAHAVIADESGRVLVLRSRYAGEWSLPGGGVDRREHLDAAVIRECREELGVEVAIERLTGLYYRTGISAYVAIFRCRPEHTAFRLSHEHSEMRWARPAELPVGLREFVEDALTEGKAVALKTLR